MVVPLVTLDPDLLLLSVPFESNALFELFIVGGLFISLKLVFNCEFEFVVS
jgi:hypothetical protein